VNDIPRRIAVAHLTPSFFSTRSVIGGGERYVLYLARALAAAFPEGRFAQTIIACGPRDETFLESGIVVRVLRNDNPAMGPMNATSRDLAREIQSFDLLHLHQSLTLFGAFAASCAAGAGKTFVAIDHGGGENDLMLHGGMLSLAAGIVSHSAYGHRLVAPYVERDFLILRGPVDTDIFTPAARSSNPEPRILCVGRILPHKGFDRVLAALPPSLHLTIAGQVYDDAYHRCLQDMSSGKRVTFVHDADDAALLALYRSADVFVQPSTSRDCYGRHVAKAELLGLTTLEAMSCGLPVIVSDAGALAELVTDSRFGRVFHDHHQLVAIFHEILQGAWPHPDAPSLARARAIEQHGLVPIGRSLGAFYDRVIEARCAS
jgi:glycosyltransferase involved in cell wall biosynthesis